MLRIGRYNMSELSLRRILFGVKMRISEIPHSLAWNFEGFSKENRDRLMSYRGRHCGERCFIVANGPSLLQTNLEFLKNEVTFGMNRIYLSFGSFTFRPTYYVAVNELILEQFSNEISGLKMPKFLNWNRRDLFDLSDPTISFLKSKLVIRDVFQPDISLPLVIGATVTFVSLQLAYFMGFTTVILVGLDHRYEDKGTPSKTERRTSESDRSHFHPQYFPKGVKWQLPDLLRSEVDFALAREAFEADDREIIDATIGGKCQVFEKADYLSLLKKLNLIR